jgi:protein-disulfide isomerase
MASGCMAVRRSVYSRVGPVPLPVIGLSAYTSLLGLALVARDKARTLYLAAFAAAGGAIGAALIGVQALKIGAFCKWCVMVDTSAIVAAFAATWLHREASRSAAYEAFLGALARRRGLLAAWAIGAAITGVLPVVWGEFPVVPPPPPAIAALAAPGKVTAVAFTDFECPYCRRMHPVLHDLAAGSGGQLAIVRKMVPLPFHPGARPAALAYLCTPADRRDEMADLLYGASEHALDHEGTIGLAGQLGLDRAAFTRCVDAPETAAQIDADAALFKQVGGLGLPLTFIGPRVVYGFQPDAARKVVRIMLAGGRPGLPVPWMLGIFGAMAAALLVITLRHVPTRAAEVAAPVP